MDMKKGRYAGNGGGKKFSMSNIVGDPFPLATIGIAVVSIPVERPTPACERAH